MSPDQYRELLATVKNMAVTADALSHTCQMLSAGETDAARHAYFHRLHVAFNDCAIGLRQAIDAAPTVLI
jgi:hypothetical protein